MMLAAQNISLTPRLTQVTAALEQGRITAICGPNGAGKSTLLQLLAGLLFPDRGKVTLDGKAPGTMPARVRAQQIGYLPQDGQVAWDIGVRNLVALGRLPHRDKGCAAIDAALEMVDMSAFADRPVSTLSGGERARVLLARVLAGEPEWLLADEPLAALDLGHQTALLKHLRAIADSGKGVVLVLHDLALAMNHADKVIVLDKGGLVIFDTPERALAPATIRQVWGVPARWLGRPGARALLVE